MKRTLFALTAALMASPVFAASDLCALNLQQLDDGLTVSGPSMGEPLRGQVTDLKNEAMKSRDAGDTKGCIASSGQALQLMKGPGDGTQGGGASGAGSQ
jgi:hypothetical protein